MKHLLYLIVPTFWVTVVLGDSCPDIFERFSLQHSYCLSAKCSFLQRGLQDDSEKAFILKLHNDLKSKLATGQERGFPTAADMMQLVWDDELQAVAQKWAEQCVFEHDCKECREVENFPVGQNIAYQDWYCSGNNCQVPDKPNWTKVVQDFYDEVALFPGSSQTVSQYQFQSNYGHFSQIAWGKTWRIGCGYVRFSQQTNQYRQQYVCNYGPTGNIISESMYTPGQQCSKCPKNSCCGSSCNSSNDPTFPGLCKMLNVNEAPVYADDLKPNLFDCDFSNNNDDCRFSVTGTNNWKIKNTLGGDYLATEMSGGDSSSMLFNKVISPNGKSFCLQIEFRKGPTMANEASSCTLSVQFKPKTMNSFDMNLDLDNPQFSTYKLDISMQDNFQFSLDAKVPSGASSQYVEIQRIAAYDGKCIN